ncbi:AbrB/MazE/SpoVT family DNA-binding domain-containing protein [Candidatus Curtissbacteria bacterium]|nr:AbrB/MazE/SpoVT family DNA-binding domain-containing protein [Candidatus Curtissbacteria bacterium]
MQTALLSAKGQITIPKKIQRQLKIGHRSKLVIYPQKDLIIIKPLKTSITEQTAGSLARFIPKDKKGVSFTQVLEETQKIVASELASK